MKEQTDIPKTDQQLDEEFAKEYEQLCKKHSRIINFVLKYMQRDDGTFSTVVTPTIIKIENK